MAPHGHPIVLTALSLLSAGRVREVRVPWKWFFISNGAILLLYYLHPASSLLMRIFRWGRQFLGALNPRLALLERLGSKARDELRVGILSPTTARQVVRLPQGNQTEVLDAMRREALSGAEVKGVVDLWLGCAERGQQQYILAHPREALSQAKGIVQPGRDPRLSEAGNHVWKRVGLLLDVLGRMEVWLAHHGRAGLTPEDRTILAPRFEKLSRDAASVAALSQDLVGEMKTAA